MRRGFYLLNNALKIYILNKKRSFIMTIEEFVEITKKRA